MSSVLPFSISRLQKIPTGSLITPIREYVPFQMHPSELDIETGMCWIGVWRYTCMRHFVHLNVGVWITCDRWRMCSGVFNNSGPRVPMERVSGLTCRPQRFCRRSWCWGGWEEKRRPTRRSIGNLWTVTGLCWAAMVEDTLWGSSHTSR